MRYVTFVVAIALASLLAFSGSSAPGQQPDNGVRGDLLKVEDLPRLRSGVQTHQFCTFDRAGDNYDWDYFALYMEPNGEAVLFDATGPGCLYRQQMNIWMTAGNCLPDTKGVNIRYYFDGEKEAPHRHGYFHVLQREESARHLSRAAEYEWRRGISYYVLPDGVPETAENRPEPPARRTGQPSEALDGPLRRHFRSRPRPLVPFHLPHLQRRYGHSILDARTSVFLAPDALGSQEARARPQADRRQRDD